MQNCLMRYADQALYYPSSEKKMGHFFFPAFSLLFGVLVFNFLVNLMGGVFFFKKKKEKNIMGGFFLIIILKSVFFIKKKN